MQGLKTPGQLTDPEGKKNGWQGTSGDQGDRDIKFFDVVLESLKKDFKVDTKRIYSTGHSNGGGFTFLLWAERGDQFTAFAPSAAAYRNYTMLKPKPALHIAGKNDPLVKFAWQELMMNAVRKINQCNDGQPWEDRVNCTMYPSPIGAPFITCIHPGTHQFPSEAPQLIVKFFKSQKQK
jgi:polyhydroxybutyrate depolymerase